MQELTPETITQAVLDQMASTPNPRMKQIMASAVKHLHAFAKDVNLTPAEWIKGIAFMTAVGKICTPARQEFILLSDTLGLSALVNGLHDETALEEGTNTSLLGPFYRETTPLLAAGSQIAKNAEPDDEVILYGNVTDVNGKPLAGATVSLWQTSATGLYDIQEDPTSVDYRGIFTTDANGLFLVRTVKPLGYSMPTTSCSVPRAIWRSISTRTIRNPRSRACRASVSTCACRAKPRPTGPADASAPIRPRS